MVYGRGTCADWTGCLIDSIELDTERGEYFSYISSSVVLDTNQSWVQFYHVVRF
jgi:hypothetical protein